MNTTILRNKLGGAHREERRSVQSVIGTSSKGGQVTLVFQTHGERESEDICRKNDENSVYAEQGVAKQRSTNYPTE